MAQRDGDLFSRLMDIGREAFARGHYVTANHALSTALHCADEMGQHQRVPEVIHTAREQMEWIDTREPAHRISSASAAARGNESMYATLITHAEAIATVARARETVQRAEQIRSSPAQR